MCSFLSYPLNKYCIKYSFKEIQCVSENHLKNRTITYGIR